MDKQFLSQFNDERIEKIRSVVAHRQKGLAIVLEDIHDPHNTAAIMRTADAFGIIDIRLVFVKEKPYDPKLIGKTSSSSANKWMDFRSYTSIAACYDDLKKEQFHIVATTLTPNAKSIEQCALTQKKLAIVFGNEHEGLSPSACSRVDETLYIPMVGMVQSLNVSVSAAIIIAETIRQRKVTKNMNHFSKLEQTKLVEDYLLR